MITNKSNPHNNNSSQDLNKFKMEPSQPSSKKTPSLTNFNKKFISFKSINLPTAPILMSHSWNFKKSIKSSKNAHKTPNWIFSPYSNKEKKTSEKFKKKPNIKRKNSNKELPGSNNKSRITKSTSNISTNKKASKKILKKNTTYSNKNSEKAKKETRKSSCSSVISKNNTKNSSTNSQFKKKKIRIFTSK